ncbi:lipase member H-like [Schistocerca piceifrons]|uniref:lipase member H-like n=1 Tax=Schistocerca piceifrons TaxID=274613 RepID=UPI001F5FF0BE|nr:lipase member H-like [Schistocerca piceifrons]
MTGKRLSSAEKQAILNEEAELGYIQSDDDEEIDTIISGGSESTEDSDEDVGDLEILLSEVAYISNQNVFKNNDTSVIDCDNIGGFDSKWPTVVLAHGWMSKSSDLDHIKNAYLTAGDYNVISIDWSPIASNAAYDQVREDLVIVGQFVAKFVDCLVEIHGLNLSRTHLVGHSLGAHVVGVIGGSLSQQNKVALITGLDPAGPGYDDNENPGNEKMLDQEDAEFVQVIHTNAGVLGYKYTLGDADFFPNGGSEQPGCATDDYGACSHGRSTLYFAESVTSASAFIGYQCDSWDTCTNCNGKLSAVMGAHVDPR